MNWYIGQRIVAIRTHSKKRFKLGDEFTIKKLQSSTCKCKGIEIDIGHKHSYSGDKYQFLCTDCNTVCPINSYIQWYDKHNFSPLDEMEAAISELMEEAMPVSCEYPPPTVLK
jgi:epoxyqueuosine reductase QueG